MTNGTRLGPLVAGLIRNPAKRNSGCANSAMLGAAARSKIKSQLPLLSAETEGVVGAVIKSAKALGGVW